MDHEQVALSSRTHWYEGLTAMHWRVLKASFLGWIFDGYEALALVVVLGPMLHSVLSPAQAASPTTYAGLVIGITLLGWGAGGLIGGIACAVKEVNPAVKVYGVQPSRLPSMKGAVAEGKPVVLQSATTIADGIAVRRAGDRTRPIHRRRPLAPQARTRHRDRHLRSRSGRRPRNHRRA